MLDNLFVLARCRPQLFLQASCINCMPVSKRWNYFLQYSWYLPICTNYFNVWTLSNTFFNKYESYILFKDSRQLIVKNFTTKLIKNCFKTRLITSKCFYSNYRLLYGFQTPFFPDFTPSDFFLTHYYRTVSKNLILRHSDTLKLLQIN